MSDPSARFAGDRPFDRLRGVPEEGGAARTACRGCRARSTGCGWRSAFRCGSASTTPPRRSLPHRRLGGRADSAGSARTGRQRAARADRDASHGDGGASARQRRARPPSWLEFLRAELAPTPGRLNATVRIVVATAIVLVTSMALEVPSSRCRCSSSCSSPCSPRASPPRTPSSVAIVSIAGASSWLRSAVALTILIFRFTSTTRRCASARWRSCSSSACTRSGSSPSRPVGFLARDRRSRDPGLRRSLPGTRGDRSGGAVGVGGDRVPGRRRRRREPPAAARRPRAAPAARGRRAIARRRARAPGAARNRRSEKCRQSARCICNRRLGAAAEAAATSRRSATPPSGRCVPSAPRRSFCWSDWSSRQRSSRISRSSLPPLNAHGSSALPRRAKALADLGHREVRFRPRFRHPLACPRTMHPRRSRRCSAELERIVRELPLAERPPSTSPPPHATVRAPTH